MPSPFSRWLRKQFSPARPRRRLRVTELEDRTAPAFGTVGGEFPVNFVSANSQQTWPETPGSVAMDADGDFVVTWSSNAQDGSDDGVYAQRYSAAGVAQGAEFRVNTTTVYHQRLSTVAMDADGDFVIAWSSFLQDGSGFGIYAQQYNAAGVARGTEFRVNTTTANDQYTSHVAMDADGDFVVAWESYNQDGSDWGVYAQRYDAAGVAQGAEFRVNTATTNRQYGSTVAMDADGDFVVAWSSYLQDGSNWGIYAQRYDEVGVAQGIEFRVNTTTALRQESQTIAMDADGDFVVTWSSIQDGSGDGVYAQLYNAAGVAQGTEFLVNTTLANNQQYSSVAMTAGGAFVVTWNGTGQDPDASTGVYAQRFTAAGATLGTEFRVNTFTTDSQWYSTVAMDADGDFAVVWTSLDQDGSLSGVYAQRYSDSDENNDTAGPVVGGVFLPGNGTDNDDLLNENERILSRPSQLVVTFGEDVMGATNLANWQLLRDGIDVSAQITSVAYGFNATTRKYEATVTFGGPLAVGNYRLVARSTLTDASGNTLDGANDGDGVGENFERAFAIVGVVASGPEFRVNTETIGDQQTWDNSPGAVAMDANGDFVVTWASDGQDGSSFGIYAQRYSAAGVAQGSEFRVNTYTANLQSYSTVAMDDVGDFVITWSSIGQDGSMSGIYAQRYNSIGVAQGSEFQVNTYTPDQQLASAVAMDADGDFIITWTSYAQDGSNAGVYAQRYNAAGAAQGPEFRVNTFTTDTQFNSTVAMDADGDFVITWTSRHQDGSLYGIYAQRYSAAGVARGGEFRVNTTTTNRQSYSTIAMDSDGDFIITWSSDGQDSSSYGVYSQRYNAAGVAQGTEFRVNTTTVNNQSFASVAMDADGDFVVAWRSDLQDGSNFGIYGQRYNAAGITEGAEFLVNTTTANAQQLSTVAMDDLGDFVVVWSSNLQDGSGNSVYGQRYRTNVTPTLADPGSRSLAELTTLNFTLLGFDLDIGESLSYSIAAGLQTGMSLNPTTGEFSWTPTETQDGIYPVTFRVTDTAGAMVDRAITITVGEANVGPTLTDPGNQSLNELATLAFSLAGADVDVIGGVAQGFTYSIQSGSQTGMSLNPTSGAFSWTPTEAQDGSYPVTFRVTDAAGSTAGRTLTITVGEVNVTPTLADPGNQSINESAVLNFTLVGADPDVIGGVAQTFTYSIATGLQLGMSLNSSSGLFAWIPTETQDGSYPVTLRVTDAAGATSNRMITLTVGEVNVSPTLANPGNHSVNELATLSITLSGSDSDIIGGVPQGLTYSIQSGSQTGMSLNSSTGAFFWTPTESQDGIYPVNFRVTDAAGSTADRAVTLTVGEANVSPTLADPGNRFVNEGSTLSFTLLGSDADVIGSVPQAFAYSIAGGLQAGMSLNPVSGSFAWSPTESQDGNYSVTFRITDAAGATADRNVAITVGEVDALPTLTGPGNQVVNELSTLNFTLFGSDPDVVAGVVQSRTYGITSGAQPGMSLNATTGAFNWTPTEGQDGVYRITVRVSDGALEALASFFITVHEVNTPPTLLGPGNVSGRVDAAVEFTVSATDPDRVGGLPENLTYSIVSGGRPGMVLDSISGQFRWTPTNEQSGVTFMTIRAQDAAGGSSTISVTLNIAGPILPPVIPLPRFRLPTGFAVTPTGLSGAVSVHQATEAATFSIDPISPAPPGGIRVAMADFNGDGTDDVVVGTGPGGSSHLRILDGKNRSELFRLDPFEAAFTGGIFVAAGDVTGDGVADLIITPDEGGGPRIRIFDGTNFLQLADFFGIDDPAFRGGARAAVGDLNGDGTGDLIVAAGFGGGPRVAGFDGKSLTQDLKVKLFGDFLAFEEGLRNGIYVAVGDIDGDGRAELIAGGGPGGGPRVSSFAGTSLVSGATPQRVVDFFAGGPTNRGGVRVATKDLDGDANADLIVGAGPGSASRVTAYTGKALRSNLTPSELFAFDPAPGFSGGVFVG